VIIAVPKCQGRVSPVFDVAARLLLVDVRDGAKSKRREVVLFEKTPEGIVRNLRELRIKVLICGGISLGLQQSLEQMGIRVVAEICGEIESVLAAYQAGRLNSPEFIMPGCCGRRWSLESEKRTANRPHRAAKLE
jgi:predicted Fe-Mo cluster-binding NifX family protein